jgi:hypothetical protein
MRSALYYPHTTVDSERLVKDALLLWDRLEYIVPWDGFDSQYLNRDVAKAMELIGAPRCPGDDEKLEAHRRLEAFVTSDLPPQFYYARNPKRYASRNSFEVYSRKLFSESWELLREAEL